MCSTPMSLPLGAQRAIVAEPMTATMLPVTRRSARVRPVGSRCRVIDGAVGVVGRSSPYDYCGRPLSQNKSRNEQVMCPSQRHAPCTGRPRCGVGSRVSRRPTPAPLCPQRASCRVSFAASACRRADPAASATTRTWSSTRCADTWSPPWANARASCNSYSAATRPCVAQLATRPARRSDPAPRGRWHPGRHGPVSGVPGRVPSRRTPATGNTATAGSARGIRRTRLPGRRPRPAPPQRRGGPRSSRGRAPPATRH